MLLMAHLASKLYPAKTNSALRTLHETIVSSTGDHHAKISVLFYILLDFDAPTGRRELSEAFAQATNLPQKYIIFMKGLWHMDHLEFSDALQYLTHPSLTPTYSEAIIEVLVRHAENNDYTYALAYYHTVQPVLTSVSALESLFRALALTSVTEAFYFSRNQPEQMRRHLLEVLIGAVHQGSPADSAVQLVNLPFTPEEEAWFQEFLLHGDGQKLRHSKDTVMMRNIGMGNFASSLAIQHKNSGGINGLNWNRLSAAVQDGLGPRCL